ncbi:P-loop containing nucleoside triphosphate hydrolase protein [Auriculariales sp. MPI-PUGE-AT-0066]|nr:P-loop containing nucleoside triphosphate hydrolase protein [Auriculariales sp. MPI-PUGE-AT-0066]
MAALRQARLDKLFEGVTSGKLEVASQTALFLEALCLQSDPLTALDRLTSKPKALFAFKSAMFFDLSPNFLNNRGSKVLQFLQHPQLAVVGGGTLLNKLLSQLAAPRFVLSAYLEALVNKSIDKDAQLAFTWLVRQLLASPDCSPDDRDFAQDVCDALQNSPYGELKSQATLLERYLRPQQANVTSSGPTTSTESRPGGRHDNDLPDFKEIAILPTADEIVCAKPPHLLTALALGDVSQDQRPETALDNQFRLLREDMMYELREDLNKHAQAKTKGGKGRGPRGFEIDGLNLHGVSGSSGSGGGPRDRCTRWALQLECVKDLDFFKNVKPQERHQFLIDNKRIIKHQSLACLSVDDKVIAFGEINRNEVLLARKLPVIVLQISGETSTIDVLSKLKTGRLVKLIQVDTAVFAYEPVLAALQRMSRPELSPELFLWDNDPLEAPPNMPYSFVNSLRADASMDVGSTLGLGKTIALDGAQSNSLLAALSQRVSLIQGPPGTGKSFVGALSAKVLFEQTSLKILVCCYTNHALDQFMEDLLDNNIPPSSMVRLGGKSTARTAQLLLSKQQAVSKLSRQDWIGIDAARSNALGRWDVFEKAFSAFKNKGITYAEMLAHLEFDEPDYFAAFTVPPDALNIVGRKGKAIDEFYLIQQWQRGWDAGALKYHHSLKAPNVAQIWHMLIPARQAKFQEWKETLEMERIRGVYDLGVRYDRAAGELQARFSAKDGAILQSKRIIGCTTTAAAKYMDSLREAGADVLLVEEAGEILEAHVLTALGQNTKQMILIGDHQQLRPKVNNYALTVEKGNGFELNVSLFERLVKAGYPHSTLKKQHRMRPEISDLVRHLTYTDLVDADGTRGRPNLRGVTDNVVFITHSHPEDDLHGVGDARDGGAKSSKQNTFEVQMVLKIIKYLAQQGYSADQVAVLTPYLGQLSKLRDALSKDNDPYLSDMDQVDLVRAGLLSAGAAQSNKKPLRLSTIDNAQGEEWNIVIISLTRSNSMNDIGFMFSPERLNVLLSRARDACIIIGNADTFRNSRKGGDLWSKLFDYMKDRGNIYDGLPVRCERHPDRTGLLCKPEDFDEHSPDGGCLEPCGVILACGKHQCPSKCHGISDHSKMRCEAKLSYICSSGHKKLYRCSDGPPQTCPKCEKEAKEEKERIKRRQEEQERREAEQKAHEKELLALEAQIESERLSQRDARAREEMENVIRLKREELEQERERSSRAAAAKAAALKTHAKPTPPSVPVPPVLASPVSTATTTAPSTVSGAASSITTTPAVIRPPDASGQATTSPVTPVAHGTTSPTLPQPASQLQTVLLGSSTQANPVGPSQPSGKPNMLLQPLPPSLAAARWQRQKDYEAAKNKHIDALMAMTGLESVKEQVLTIRDRIELATRQNTSLKDERFNISLLGNPGTGKTTVARLYAKFLASIDLLPGDAFVETTGSLLSSDGIPGTKKHIDHILAQGGGAMFIDECYQLVSPKYSGGRQVLDFLLAEMENNVGKMIFIVAGYTKEMEDFFEHNPGIPSRVPHTLRFEDYTDQELLHMFQTYVNKKYSQQMKFEDGFGGLYARITIRRLGRGRGRHGFGNARAMQNLFQRIADRQSVRIRRSRTAGMSVDDMLFTKEDLIGPDPSTAVTTSEAWSKLKKMIGLNSVKQSVEDLIDLISTNYKRELQEKEPLQVTLNRVFYGNPGTGKTTVANIYGQILADIGMLSKGEVVMKNPSDFKGQHIGASEAQTKDILKSTVGKVLVIDEAYMLYKGGGSDDLRQTDQFSAAVIDTIVAEVHNVPGDDRCVLLLGYEPQMQDMFQNSNPGLSRRFDVENPFRFEDFSDAELLQILDLKMGQQDMSATDEAKKVVIDVLGRSRLRPNFGNGGEVENLLTRAKISYQKRQSQLPTSQRSHDAILEPVDIDANFNRVENSAAALAKLFEDVVDADKIVKKLEGYQNVARRFRSMGKEPRDAKELIPTCFVFKGPPGTGKTTTARKMGQVFCDMGMLSSGDVVESSASDLVGQYVGHTGPKTKKLFEKALGKVLFIDEAYRLGEGRFAQEAIDEMVALLTHETFAGKIVVILAGYTKDIDRLMTVNSGLSSRFPEEITFDNIAPEKCIDILTRQLQKQDIHSPTLVPGEQERIEVVATFKLLGRLPSWGNARDVITLSKEIARETVNTTDPNISTLQLPPGLALNCAKKMLKDKRDRLPTESGRAKYGWLNDEDMPAQEASSGPPPPPSTKSNTNAQGSGSGRSASPPPPPPPPKTLGQNTSTAPPQHSNDTTTRDAGVSDAVWRQLHLDKQVELAMKKRRQDEASALAKSLEEARARAEEERRRVEELERKAAADAEARRMLEEQRQRELAAQREQERLRKLQEEAIRREQERRRREEATQQKLRALGVCVAGYQWIRQSDGYRCSAGGHFVTNAELGI